MGPADQLAQSIMDAMILVPIVMGGFILLGIGLFIYDWLYPEKEKR